MTLISELFVYCENPIINLYSHTHFDFHVTAGISIIFQPYQITFSRLIKTWHEWYMPWWRNQMEIFSALLALCEGNPLVTRGFPSKCQWRRALVFSLICVWINNWANNRDAGDLRRHCARYDVIVILSLIWLTNLFWNNWIDWNCIWN